MSFIRSIAKTVAARIAESRRTIQVLSGPRQVGKTTIIKQSLEDCDCVYHYVSSDLPTIQDIYWINQQWDIARNLAKQYPNKSTLLVLDEVQKIPNWSDMVKKLWDEDSFYNVTLKVILLGSAPLLMQQGLTESLAGRFETIHITHWSYAEMREAFGFGLDQYIYFGGYPGAAEYIKDEERWRDYIVNSLIETTISRDVLLLSRIDKPALLRQVFQLGCSYSSQIFSYQKMLGQLHDAGNATTVAHYLKLLGGAGLLIGVEKYAGGVVQKKASSPKLQVLNNALISAQRDISFDAAFKDRAHWGRLVESAVGAYLCNEAANERFKIYYWRERNCEIDFIIEHNQKLIGLEVKSGLKKTVVPGFKQFKRHYQLDKMLLVGGQGIPVSEFLQSPTERWFS